MKGKCLPILILLTALVLINQLALFDPLPVSGQTSPATQSQAAKRLEIEYPEVPGSGYPSIPGAPEVTPSTTLPEYILYLFWFALAILGITAFSAFIYAGVLWLTAAGNTSQVEKAKQIFVNVFLGVILILGAFLLFQLLNPELLFLSGPDLPTVALINKPICMPTVKTIQETCQSRGSAWMPCTPSQQSAAACNSNDDNGDGLADEICCRRLPSGRLGELCPKDLSSVDITGFNSCQQYASIAETLKNQNINPDIEDIKNWCNNDTCGLSQQINDFCYWQGRACRSLKDTITSCQDYGLITDNSTWQRACKNDPFQVGPCEIKEFPAGQNKTILSCEPTQ